jgi:predicted porin
MRKVLLATTALVALGGVSAANADISISGAAEFAYDQPTTGSNAMSVDGSLVISAKSTTDSGLTFSAVHDMKFEGCAVNVSAGTTACTDYNDAYIGVSGDFGSVTMGYTDTALDKQDGKFTGRSLAVQEAGNKTGNSSGSLIGGDSTAINFYAPSISGLSLVASVDEENNRTDIGAHYSIAGIDLGYQTRSSSTDYTLVGVGASLGPVRIQALIINADTAGTKVRSKDVGVSYTAGDVYLAAHMSKANDTNKDENRSLGAMYTVAPGVTARIESYYGKKDGTVSEGVYSELRVSF